MAEKASSELLRFRDAEIIERGQERVEALRAEKEEAERSNVAKSRFLAAASHDLRQPLHALGLFVGALDERVHDPEARELVDKIQDSTRALEEMFDALLDISQLDAGAMRGQRHRRVAAFRARALEHEFQPQARARDCDCAWCRRVSSVRSDRPAVAHRPEPAPMRSATPIAARILVGCRRRGDAVRIDVVDTGRGMPRERRREIFEEFRRLEDDPARAGEGLGLGLAIVERLARLLGHRVDVASMPGRGSRFSVTVPAPVRAPAGERRHRSTVPSTSAASRW